MDTDLAPWAVLLVLCPLLLHICRVRWRPEQVQYALEGIAFLLQRIVPVVSSNVVDSARSLPGPSQVAPLPSNLVAVQEP